MVGVHFDGRPCSSDAADAVCGALVEAWAPGPEGGPALAAVLTGTENFTGKLPCTVAGNAAQIPLYYNHDNGSCWTMENEGMAPGYVDGPRTPRYAFGHGLSYTSFAYGAPELSATAVAPDGAVTVTVPVTNTGAVPGTEVVQLYIRDPVASRVRPNRELAGFARVALAPGRQSGCGSGWKHPSSRFWTGRAAGRSKPVRSGCWRVRRPATPGAKPPSPSRPTAMSKARSGRSGPRPPWSNLLRRVYSRTACQFYFYKEDSHASV